MSKKNSRKKESWKIIKLSKLYSELQKVVYKIKNYKSKNIYKIYFYIKNKYSCGKLQKKNLKRSKYISLIKKKKNSK